MMLRHLNFYEHARRIEQACFDTIREGKVSIQVYICSLFFIKHEHWSFQFVIV